MGQKVVQDCVLTRKEVRICIFSCPEMILDHIPTWQDAVLTVGFLETRIREVCLFAFHFDLANTFHTKTVCTYSAFFSMTKDAEDKVSFCCGTSSENMTLRVFTLMTQWQKIDARVKNLWSVWTNNLMLSIGRHVDFDARASEILTPPSQYENPYSLSSCIPTMALWAAWNLKLQDACTPLHSQQACSSSEPNTPQASEVAVLHTLQYKWSAGVIGCGMGVRMVQPADSCFGSKSKAKTFTISHHVRCVSSLWCVSSLSEQNIQSTWDRWKCLCSVLYKAATASVQISQFSCWWTIQLHFTSLIATQLRDVCFLAVWEVETRCAKLVSLSWKDQSSSGKDNTSSNTCNWICEILTPEICF